MTTEEKPKGRLWLKRLLAIVVGLLIGSIVVEIGLMVSGQPKFPMPVRKMPQFDLSEDESLFVAGGPLYRNSISRKIRFIYHDNPRDYFGKENEVIHETNSLGFRGSEFPKKKKPGERRVLFLGDSFTFGEGVWLADTYPVVAEKELQKNLPSLVSLNLGVSGYNTVQANALLNTEGVKHQPDAVVLGFVLNDPEPPLFVKPRFADRITRRPRRIEGWFSDPFPPRSVRFRISKLIWSFSAQRARTAHTLQHYRDLFHDMSTGWQHCQLALREIAATCEKRKIPFCVVIFPVLYQLEDYPFADIHARLTTVIGTENVIDLLPKLQGKKASDLWVHATDQHPNEQVHRLAGKLVAEHLSAHQLFK